MGRRGRAKITRRFALDQAVEGYQAIIMEVVAPAERRLFANANHAGLNFQSTSQTDRFLPADLSPSK